MPIGKNAIKRVANNGYSNVNTSAPDMENSVIEAKEEPKKKASTKPTQKKASAEKTASAAPKTQTKKAASAKPAAKKETPKKAASKSTSPKKETEKEVTTTKSYCNFGDALPTHLL